MLVHLSAASCCQVLDALEDCERHYHTPHRHVCSFCRRAFPSGHPLDTCVLEWHAPPSRSRPGTGHVPEPVEDCTEAFGTSRDREKHL